MATISSSTSGSIDVDSIVKGLMTAERLPLNNLNTKEASFQAKLTAMGLIKSKVDSFQTALKSLTDSGTNNFLTNKATSSDTAIFSASAGTTAVAGSYSLEVSSLAQSQKLVAAGQTSSTDAIGTGAATTITFDFGTISGGTLTDGSYSGASFASGGTTQSIVIDSSNNTLEGIRDAINTASMGVTATIVNDGSGTPYRLALSSNNSGISNSLKISTDGGDASINSLLAHDPAGVQNLNQTVAAQNANFKVNGIPITKTSNTVTDAIQGISLTLNSVTTAPATLTVARDTASISDSVSGFVKAYNDLYSTIKSSSAYKSKQALEGDFTLRAMQSQLRSIGNSTVSGGIFSNLQDVGLSFKTDGTLQLDSAKFDSAMSSNFTDVANLFNSTTGFATQFKSWASSILAVDGTIASRTSGINQSLKDIGTRKDIFETRMTALESVYRKQFSSLNVTLSEMGKTSAYLTQQLSRL